MSPLARGYGTGYQSGMKQPIPLTRDLVLIGGGHTHALVLRSWGMKPLAGVRVTVINPGPTAPYSGMLPGFVAGHYTRDELDIDLVKLCRLAGARLIDGSATHIDPVAKTITVEGRPPVAYDVAAVDVGITSQMPRLDGFADHGVPAKPLGTFATRWDAFRAKTKSPRIAVIGGGVAGAELAMAMAHALREKAPKISLIDRGEVLDGFNAAARSRLLAALDELGVTCVENADVVRVGADAVHLADGRAIPSDFTTGAAGARPHDWLADCGLDHQDGFLTVNKTLQTSDPDIFAVGDCAHLSHAPRPKAGVFAVREAPYLFDNLRARLSGGVLRPFWPQKDYLKLISLGGKEALAEKFGTARRGRLLWAWKDRIDRAFMDQFEDLPVMESERPLQTALGVDEALGDAPFCGGCGAKVGRDALGHALAQLPAEARSDVEHLPGDDAGLLRTGGVDQVLTTDHLSAVVEDPVTMARIATVHALGDVWAMGAQPQAAVLSLILPRMSSDLQARTVAEVAQSVHEVLHTAGAALVGGHTTMGDTMTIGLSITGLCDAPPITLSGAKPGDALVLTKPIGSGVIMAADMRRQARGENVLACLKWMQTPQQDAALALRDAHAMTDVTGFGLAGHLSGMCTASQVGATVHLHDVPLMEGALELAEAGVRSSIYPDNRQIITGDLPDIAQADLMFDPQTGGGLLAAVEPSTAAALGDGYWVIGSVTHEPGIRFLTS